MNLPDKCPHCQCSLRGKAIPESEREEHGGQTHYSRLMALEINDKPKYWRCYKCECHWEINNPKPVYWWECD